MTDLDVKKLGQIIDLLRTKNVRAFAHGTLHIEFQPIEAGPVVEPAPMADDEPAEKCRCGHEPYHHQNGLCVQCADPTLCLQPSAAS